MTKEKISMGGGQERTLRKLSTHKESPKFMFVVLLVLYFATMYALTRIGRATAGPFNGPPPGLDFLGMNIPIQSFAGVFASLGNICFIYLVVFYKKVGFYTTLSILVVTFPYLLHKFFIRHNSTALSGVFSTSVCLVAIILIHMNNERIARYQKRLRDQAITDKLTGLPNRFACTELMQSLISKNVKFALVSVDFNNFKSINDTMGHDVGDEVLSTIAERWRNLAESWKTGTVDFVTHLGGDEYAIIIRGYENEEEIGKTIDAYRKELEKKIVIDECDYFITACFGYSEYPDDADNVGALFSDADAAMHEVKRAGSSSHILHFTPDLIDTEHALEIERKLRTALENDYVFFYLQPQFDLDHKLRGFEALARIKDNEGAVISPVDFIPIAEKIGIIDRIDNYVFREAAKFVAELIKKSGKGLVLSVNVSVKHLMRNNFLDELKELLNASGLNAGNLEIEITESIMIDSGEKSLEILNAVKALGIRLAIDDFGTGYSSLSYLNKLPADILKIDKSFIDVMNTSESSKQYIASIISIGHVLNMKVVSEGVESDDQIKTLTENGCDYIQGYVWGRPMPPKAAAELVNS